MKASGEDGRWRPETSLRPHDASPAAGAAEDSRGAARDDLAGFATDASNTSRPGSADANQRLDAGPGIQSFVPVEAGASRKVGKARRRDPAGMEMPLTARQSGLPSESASAVGESPRKRIDALSPVVQVPRAATQNAPQLLDSSSSVVAIKAPRTRPADATLTPVANNAAPKTAVHAEGAGTDEEFRRATRLLIPRPDYERKAAFPAQANDAPSRMDPAYLLRTEEMERRKTRTQASPAGENTIHIGMIDIHIAPPVAPVNAPPTRVSPARAAELSRGFASSLGLRQG